MMKKNTKKSLIAIGIALVACVVLVLLDTMPGVPGMLVTVLQKGAIFSLVAVSMNLLNGFTGLFSLGQAGFMLLGAYSYAILTVPVAQRMSVWKYYDGGVVQFALPVLVALLVGGLLAAGCAYLIGLPVLKLKSDYLAVATLGFAEIVRAIVQSESIGPLTNGSNLIFNFPHLNTLTFLGINAPPTLAAFLLSGVCILVVVLLINSTYGRAFMAIRDDEIAAEAMGINLAKHKRMAFVISSFFAGISGGLLAMFQATVSANIFKAAMTYEILLIVVIGGIGSISGSCIGAFAFYACSEWLMRFLDDPSYNIGGLNILRGGFRMVVFSVVIMLVVLFRREGLMGNHELSDLPKLWRRRKSAKEKEAQAK